MTEDANDPVKAGEPATSERETGLPGLHSWRSVYAVVLGVFILWLGLLTWFTVHYTP